MMQRYFIDTFYLIVFSNSRDQSYLRAILLPSHSETSISIRSMKCWPNILPFSVPADLMSERKPPTR